MPTPTRCPWAESNLELFADYHDREWGVPVHDDRTHFEYLILEGAQAGLSWATILRRREAYRRAFADFDPQVVARFDARRVRRLLGDAGIIRNRAKVHSAVTNARAFLEIVAEYGSFDDYIWSFTGGRQIVNRIRTHDELPPSSAESDLLSKDLRRRGFKFTGSTIMYAHMQAAGLVNDHLVSCFRFKACKAPGARVRRRRPTAA